MVELAAVCLTREREFVEKAGASDLGQNAKNSTWANLGRYALLSGPRWVPPRLRWWASSWSRVTSAVSTLPT